MIAVGVPLETEIDENGIGSLNLLKLAHAARQSQERSKHQSLPYCERRKKHIILCYKPHPSHKPDVNFIVLVIQVTVDQEQLGLTG